MCAFDWPSKSCKLFCCLSFCYILNYAVELNYAIICCWGCLLAGVNKVIFNDEKALLFCSIGLVCSAFACFKRQEDQCRMTAKVQKKKGALFTVLQLFCPFLLLFLLACVLAYFCPSLLLFLLVSILACFTLTCSGLIHTSFCYYCCSRDEQCSDGGCI